MADANGLVSGHAYTITKVMTVCATYLQYPVHNSSFLSFPFLKLWDQSFGIHVGPMVTFIIFSIAPCC